MSFIGDMPSLCQSAELYLAVCRILRSLVQSRVVSSLEGSSFSEKKEMNKKAAYKIVVVNLRQNGFYSFVRC